MTKFKVYRLSGTGSVYAEIVEANDWMSLFSQYQYSGIGPIFRVEVAGTDYVSDNTPAERLGTPPNPLG